MDGVIPAVSVDMLRDQIDALFYLQANLFSDWPEIEEALRGAGNFLYSIYEEYELGYEQDIIIEGFGGRSDNKYTHEQFVRAAQDVRALLNQSKESSKFYFVRRGLSTSLATKYEEEFILDDDFVWDLLVEQSGYARSFPDPDKVDITDIGIDEEDDRRAYVTVEDYYYQTEDPEANRTFAIVHASPGVDNSGIDFEEL